MLLTFSVMMRLFPLFALSWCSCAPTLSCLAFQRSVAASRFSGLRLSGLPWQFDGLLICSAQLILLLSPCRCCASPENACLCGAAATCTKSLASSAHTGECAIHPSSSPPPPPLLRWVFRVLALLFPARTQANLLRRANARLRFRMVLSRPHCTTRTMSHPCDALLRRNQHNSSASVAALLGPSARALGARAAPFLRGPILPGGI